MVLVGTGAAGNITVTAAEVTLTGGVIAASTIGNGGAGNVTVTGERLTLTGGGGIASSSGFVDPTSGAVIGGTGAVGMVAVTAKSHVSVTGGSAISASTVHGPGGQVTLTAPTLTLDNGGNIQAQTIGDGAAGSITIAATQLTIGSGAGISSTSGLFDLPTRTLLAGTGAAGNVTVTATDVTLNGGRITASTLTDGRAGSIIVAGERLTLTGGASLGSASGLLDAANPSDPLVVAGTGAAGDVVVKATSAVTVADNSVISASTVTGPGGQVSITTPMLALETGAISASTIGDGAAGNVVLDIERLTLAAGAQINSTSGIFIPQGLVAGTGQGGTVAITAREEVTITGQRPGPDNAQSGILSTTFGGGDAGTISITTPALALDGEALIDARTLGDGNAGDVHLAVARLTLAGGAQIGSSSGIAAPGAPPVVGAGQGGSVTVTATESIALLPQRCAERLREGQISSFVVVGRDGVPAEPEGGLPSPIVGATTDMAGQENASAPSATTPQGMVRVDAYGTPVMRGGAPPAFFQAALTHNCAGLQPYPSTSHNAR